MLLTNFCRPFLSLPLHSLSVYHNYWEIYFLILTGEANKLYLKSFMEPVFFPFSFDEITVEVFFALKRYIKSTIKFKKILYPLGQVFCLNKMDKIFKNKSFNNVSCCGNSYWNIRISYSVFFRFSLFLFGDKVNS